MKKGERKRGGHSLCFDPIPIHHHNINLELMGRVMGCNATKWKESGWNWMSKERNSWNKREEGAEGEGGKKKVCWRWWGGGGKMSGCTEKEQREGGMKGGDVSTKGLLLRNTHVLLFPLIIPLQDKGEGSSDGWRKKWHFHLFFQGLLIITFHEKTSFFSPSLPQIFSLPAPTIDWNGSFYASSLRVPRVSLSSTYPSLLFALCSAV